MPIKPTRPKLPLVFSLLLVIGGGCAVTRAATLDYSTGFAGAAGLVLNGSASIVGSELFLTPATGGTGSAFADTTIGVDGFTTQFQFVIDGGDGTAGADGFAFVLQNDPRGASALGGSGGYHGYRGDFPQGIRPAIAIEIDTYYNPFDPTPSQHIEVVTQGVSGNAVTEGFAVAPGVLNDGAPWWAWIEYAYDAVTPANSTLDVYLARTATRPATPLLSLQLDIPAFLGTPTGYVGFTGATGGLINAHHLQSWQYTSLAADLAVPESGALPLVALGLLAFVLGMRCPAAAGR